MLANLPSVKRRVHWLWRNEQYGYGYLILGTTQDGKKETISEYFAQAQKGPLGRVWELSRMVTGVGMEYEVEVNLVASDCTCADFHRAGTCEHLLALSWLENKGRL